MGERGGLLDLGYGVVAEQGTVLLGDVVQQGLWIGCKYNFVRADTAGQAGDPAGYEFAVGVLQASYSRADVGRCRDTPSGRSRRVPNACVSEPVEGL